MWEHGEVGRVRERRERRESARASSKRDDSNSLLTTFTTPALMIRARSCMVHDRASAHDKKSTAEIDRRDCTKTSPWANSNIHISSLVERCEHSNIYDGTSGSLGCLGRTDVLWSLCRSAFGLLLILPLLEIEVAIHDWLLLLVGDFASIEELAC